MSEIVEILARKMCEREGRNPDQVVGWPEYNRLRWKQWEEDAKEAVRSLEAIGISAATLAGLRDGSLVAVPREPTEAFIAAIRYAKKRGMLAGTSTPRRARHHSPRRAGAGP